MLRGGLSMAHPLVKVCSCAIPTVITPCAIPMSRHKTITPLTCGEKKSGKQSSARGDTLLSHGAASYMYDVSISHRWLLCGLVPGYRRGGRRRGRCTAVNALREPKRAALRHWRSLDVTLYRL